MSNDQRTHYPRARREEGSQLSRHSSSSMGRPMQSSHLRPDDPRRTRTPGYTLPPPQPRTDRNFLVPRSDAPRPALDTNARMREIESTLLNQTGNPAFWQSRVPPPPPPQSTQSIYYHPATQQRTPFAQHLTGESIHRPSTAPPQQLRSVLAPPQSPDRYRTPRPRSPVEDYPGEFFCKRCAIKFAAKKGFTDHMAFTHGIVRMPPPRV